MAAQVRPAAAAATEPLPGGTGVPVRRDAGRSAARRRGVEPAQSPMRAPTPMRALRRWADGEPVADDLRARRLQPGDASSAGATASTRAASRGSLDRAADRRPRERPAARASSGRSCSVRLLTYWNSRRIAAEFRRRGIWPSATARSTGSSPGTGTNRPSYVRGCPVRATSGRAPTSSGTSTSRARSSCRRRPAGPAELPLRRARRRPQPVPARHPRGAQPRRPSGSSTLLDEAIELCGVPHELMTDNGTPFVTIVRTMLSRFQRTPRRARGSATSGPRSTRPGRTARSRPSGRPSRPRCSTASTSPTSRRPRPRSPPTRATTTTTGSTASSSWQTPAERFDGTPFTDRGFEHVPSLAAVAALLDGAPRGDAVS